MLLFVASYVCLITDGYYFFWVKNITAQLPPKHRETSISALLGYGNAFKRELTVGALKAKDMAKKGGKAAGKAAGKGAKKVAGLYKEKARRPPKSNLGVDMDHNQV